jgi:uncharacterized protein YecA (UPF0149 family)
MNGDSEMMSLITDVHKLIGETEGMISDTKTVVNTLGTLTPQIAALSTHMSEIDLKLEAAEKAKDTQKITSLKLERANDQAKLANLSKTIALSLAPGVITDMESLMAKWHTEDQRQDWDISNIDVLAHRQIPNATPEEKSAFLETYRKKRSDMNAGFTSQSISILTTENSLKKTLLSGSSEANAGQQRSMLDRVQAGETLTWSDLMAEIAAMRTLVHKLSQPQPPTIGILKVN